MLHLARGNIKRYAACFECTAPVQKGFYHDVLACSMSILPLGEEYDLPPDKVLEIKRAIPGRR